MTRVGLSQYLVRLHTHPATWRREKYIVRCPDLRLDFTEQTITSAIKQRREVAVVERGAGGIVSKGVFDQKIEAL